MRITSASILLALGMAVQQAAADVRSPSDANTKLSILIRPI